FASAGASLGDGSSPDPLGSTLWSPSKEGGSRMNSQYRIKATRANRAPTHQTARHPTEVAKSGARLNMITFPIGTHVPQTPIAIPCFSRENQSAIEAGPTPAINPMPTPSTPRLAKSNVALPASAPQAEPPTRQPTANTPAPFGPSFCRISPAGKAKTKPVRAKTDINIPAWLRLSWNACMSTGISGGTLN